MNLEALKAANAHDPSSPGKFEGENQATVYFWHCILDGDGDLEGDTTWFEPDAAERAYFILPTTRYWIEESDNGFVYGNSE